MKGNSSVRKPSLTHSTARTNDDEIVPIGTILRREQRNLVFRRCLYIIFIMLLISAIAYLYLIGYIDVLLDNFYSLLG